MGNISRTIIYLDEYGKQWWQFLYINISSRAITVFEELRHRLAIDCLGIEQRLDESIKSVPVFGEDLDSPGERPLQARMNTRRKIRIAIKHGGRIPIIAIEQRLDSAESEAALHGKRQLRRARQIAVCGTKGNIICGQVTSLHDRAAAITIIWYFR
jgi:hypothetical protein